MKKYVPHLLCGLLVVAVIAFFARNFVARKSVEIGVERVTGFPMEIGSVNLVLFKSQIDARNIKLMNPADFEDKLFAELPELYIDYRLGSMLRREPHINDMLVDIKQLAIIKNSKGESNAKKLKGAVSSSGDNSTRYRMDTLRIRVGTVTIKDFSRAKPTERKIPLNIDATYKNITDSTDITRLVLLTVMSQARLPDIGIRPDDLKKGLGNVTDVAGQVVKGTAETVEQVGKGLFDAIKEVVPEQQK